MSRLIFGISIIFTIFIIAVKSQNCGPTPQVLPETCCSIPQFFDDTDLIKCKTARTSRAKRFATSRMELGTCYLDCVFETTNITFSGGRVLNTHVLLKILLKETPNEPQATQVITNAVSQCINDLNTGVLKIRNPTVSNCSTIPSAIMICIHKNFFMNCPTNRFFNSLPCMQLKDYLKRCPIGI
ncbi:hypothetical protein ACKWTF_002731 [Chironomus riparius]